MKHYYLALSFFFLYQFHVNAQILGPGTAIVGQPATWTSGISGTTSYTWNIGDISNQPLPPQLIAREVVIDPIECADYPSVWFDPSDGHYYAFFLSGGITAAAYAGQQNLWRVDLGTDPSSGTPPNNGNPTNLGNFGLGRGADCSHAIAYDSVRGEWSCFLLKTGYNGSGSTSNTARIMRVDFGNTLSNNPTTATQVNTPPVGAPIFEFQAADSKIMCDRGNYILFVGNRWRQPARVNFGTDLRNVNPVCDMLPTVPTHGVGVGATTYIRSSAIDIVCQDGNWYLFSTTTDASGNAGAKLWRHDFGNSLANAPSRLTGLAVSAMGSHHWALRIIPGMCGKEFYGYAQHSQGYIERLDFNGDLESAPVVMGNVAARSVNGWPGIGPRAPWDPSGFATFVYKDSLYALTSGHSWNKLYITNLMYNFGSAPEQKYPPDNSFTHTFTGPPGNYDITLTVNMQGFGAAQFCRTITVVGAPPSPKYTYAPADVCKVDTIVYEVDSVSGTTSWEWTYTGSGVQYAAVTTVPRNELIFTPLATDGTLRVRATNSYGTGAYSDTAIRVRARPSLSVSPSAAQDICEGDTLRLTAYADIPVSYQWQRNGVSNGVVSQQLLVWQTGDYSVTVTTPDGYCPVSSPPLTVTVYPQPVADLGNDTNLCVSALPIILISGNTPPPGTHYLWSSGLSTLTMDATRGGWHWLELSLGDCVHRDSILVTAINDPEVYIGADTIICEQFPLRIGQEVPGATYAWSNEATTAYTDVNSTGRYILAVDLEGCVVHDTIEITAMPAPDIDLGADRDICPEQTIVLDASYGSRSLYSWNTGESTPSISVTSAGIYWVEVISEHRCVGRDTLDLSYYPKPVVSLGPDTAVCEETPLLLNPFRINTDSLLWSDGSVGNVLSIKYGGTYLVTAINKCGTGTDTIRVKDIFCDIWMPNAFTPNSDGVNDVFRALGNLGSVSGFGLGIYNRWGERVYFSEDRYRGWDGFYKGTPAPLGTYVYSLEFERDGRKYEQKGSFHLLR